MLIAEYCSPVQQMNAEHGQSGISHCSFETQLRTFGVFGALAKEIPGRYLLVCVRRSPKYFHIPGTQQQPAPEPQI